ncbi:uncharacterized protein APUU_50943A [Aspergillus puulaauensis]|uniref:Uncharacterized protein n=1 Tax=Aspergillus puulaauensis TaxID=1220207 RepID=A0A7R8APS2_9EURO|nr:uncharacterized protein APUU_50943A [Aspergillus puulaauensis]BCS26232.1 hypothetical protein APUU_50943A [Aspergillus puulaauensis]
MRMWKERVQIGWEGRSEEIGFVAVELALGGFLLHHHHHYCIFCVLCFFISRSAKIWAGGYLLSKSILFACIGLILNPVFLVSFVLELRCALDSWVEDAARGE